MPGPRVNSARAGFVLFRPADLVFDGRVLQPDNYNIPIPKSMGTYMKTTIEVSSPLFLSAKDLARQRKTTLRALVEEGLRRVIAEDASSLGPAFKLDDASVRGREMLISDPRHWQELEDEHVVRRAARPRA